VGALGSPKPAAWYCPYFPDQLGEQLAHVHRLHAGRLGDGAGSDWRACLFDSFEHCCALAGPPHLWGVALDAPEATATVEAHGLLDLDQIAPLAVQDECPGSVALKHQDGVGRAGEPERAADGVKSIIGVGLAQVMHHHDGDAELDGELA